LSESQLNRAKLKDSSQNLNIDFQKQDARSLNLDKEFDLIIMLGEGAFPPENRLSRFS
jgi:2-polyprenyl-3-methyl-5-hydroxy-6-metoxy-1,4-benzoquinol methylase